MLKRVVVVVRPFPSNLNFFNIFELQPGLNIDKEDLQKKYYALSKEFHPDFFVSASAEDKARSLQWSSIINKAYKTLSDDLSRANYLVQLMPPTQEFKEEIPLELAEAYFEIEDGGDLTDFKIQIESIRKTYAEEWDAFLKVEKFEQDHIDRLKQYLIRRAYLDSLVAAMEKKAL